MKVDTSKTLVHFTKISVTGNKGRKEWKIYIRCREPLRKNSETNKTREKVRKKERKRE